jgi:uncharacterized protein (DUF58 family)
MSLPKELIRKVKRIQIQTNHLVSDVLAGEYHSTFKGRGMEFSEVREYVPGDDIRTLDWNVTARMNRPFVRQYVEERELTVILLVDVSASGHYSSQQQTKNEIAAELSAVLALSAIKNNDKVGLILFTDRIEKYIPPKKGRSHVLRVIREVLSFDARGRRTDMSMALDFLNKAVHKRSVVFLISDFLTSGYERLMRVVARRHDLICMSLSDICERNLPDIGLVHLQDAESGEIMLFDTGDANIRQKLGLLYDQKKTEEKHFFRRQNIDHVAMQTDQSYVKPLIGFFRNRDKWKR